MALVVTQPDRPAGRSREPARVADQAARAGARLAASSSPSSLSDPGGARAPPRRRARSRGRRVLRTDPPAGRCSTSRGSGASTCTARSCRAIAARRRSSRRSSPETRQRRHRDPDGRGRRHRSDRVRSRPSPSARATPTRTLHDRLAALGGDADRAGDPRASRTARSFRCRQDPALRDALPDHPEAGRVPRLVAAGGRPRPRDPGAESVAGHVRDDRPGRRRAARPRDPRAADPVEAPGGRGAGRRHARRRRRPRRRERRGRSRDPLASGRPARRRSTAAELLRGYGIAAGDAFRPAAAMSADPARARRSRACWGRRSARSNARPAPGPAAARARELFLGVRRHLITIDTVLERYVANGVARVEPRLLEALRIGAFQLLYELRGAAAARRRVDRHARRDVVEEARLPERRAAQARVRALDRRLDQRSRRGPATRDHRPSRRRPLSASRCFRTSSPTSSATSAPSSARAPGSSRRLLREVGDEIDALLLALMLPLPVAVRVNRLRADADAVEAALRACGATILRRFGDVLEIRVRRVDRGLSAIPRRTRHGPGRRRVGGRAVRRCRGGGADPRPLRRKRRKIDAPRRDLRRQGRDRRGRRQRSPAREARRERRAARDAGHPAAAARGRNARLAPSVRPRPRRRPVLEQRRAHEARRGPLPARPATVTALARKQLELLDRGATCVKPGGVLVYSTCSILPQENGAVVERFLARHGRLRPRGLAALVSARDRPRRRLHGALPSPLTVAALASLARDDGLYPGPPASAGPTSLEPTVRRGTAALLRCTPLRGRSRPAPAEALLSESVAREWRPLSTRLDASASGDPDSAATATHSVIACNDGSWR